MLEASCVSSPGLTGRSLFLASVRSEAEAEIALGARADIIDVKDPDRGALGALDPDTTRAILAAVAGHAPVSATIGDLPMQPSAIRNAVLERAALGVDYVKIGLFPGGDPGGCLDGLRPVARSIRLVVVLFADRPLAFDAVAAAAQMGAAGIMLDTASKGAGSLLGHLDLRAITRFVTDARAQGLIVGLAGSLTGAEVPELLQLRPDLLGFRGALCHGSRNAALDPLACAVIRALIPEAGLAPIPRPEAELPEAAAAEALC